MPGPRRCGRGGAGFIFQGYLFHGSVWRLLRSSRQVKRRLLLGGGCFSQVPVVIFDSFEWATIVMQAAVVLCLIGSAIVPEIGAKVYWKSRFFYLNFLELSTMLRWRKLVGHFALRSKAVKNLVVCIVECWLTKTRFFASATLRLRMTVPSEWQFLQNEHCLLS